MDLPSAAELLAQLEDSEEVFSTRSMWLDIAICASRRRKILDPKTGCMGVPAGAMIECFGWNQTGKTLLGEMIARSVLDRDPNNHVMFLLAEKPNLRRLKDNGLDLNRVKIWSFSRNPADMKKDPDGFITGEEGLDIALEYVRKDMRFKYVLIDSISALVSSAETDGKKEGQVASVEAAKMIPGVRARLLKSFLLDWNAFNNANAILFMTNLMSESIGPDYMLGSNFKMKTGGGRYKEGASFLRIQSDSTLITTEKSTLTNVEDAIGMELYYRIIKNKYAPDTGNRRVITKFYFDQDSFDKSAELFTLGKYLGLIVEESKSYYRLPGVDKLLHGQDQTEAYINEHPDISSVLEKAIIAESGEIYGRHDKKANKLRTKEALDQAVVGSEQDKTGSEKKRKA